MGPSGAVAHGVNTAAQTGAKAFDVWDMSDLVMLFEFDAVLEDLDALWQEVEAELQRHVHGLDGQTLAAFRLAVVEAAASAVLACAEDASPMTLQVSCRAGRLQSAVRRRGATAEGVLSRSTLASDAWAAMMPKSVDAPDDTLQPKTVRLSPGWKLRTKDLS